MFSAVASACFYLFSDFLFAKFRDKSEVPPKYLPNKKQTEADAFV